MPYDNQPAPFVIEKGVPLPGRSRAGARTETGAAIQALARAEIGDSVRIPIPAGKSVRGFQSRLSAHISYFGRGWAAARNTGDGSFRIWKIAEPKGRA